MKIIVNHKEAVLKKGSSFEYIKENRFITEAEEYSLTITFPLKGCSQNIEIFGNIHRKDISIKEKLLDCEIHDRNVHIYGSITIIEINEKEVKTQFLKGKSVANFYTDLDELYINEMSLGTIAVKNNYDPNSYWSANSESNSYVVLPWVNNTSGNVQNNIIYNEDKKKWEWTHDKGTEYLAPQIYLIYIAKKIATVAGYSATFSAWEASNYKHLLLMNTFPSTWELYDIAARLPHWTVSEFFHQLELLMNASFVINDKKKTIEMSWNISTIGKESTTIETIVDEFTTEIQDETKDTYTEQTNIQFAEDSLFMQKYYSCRWLIQQMEKEHKVNRWSSKKNMISAVTPFKTITGALTNNNYIQNIHYAADIDTYFLMKCISATYDENGNVATRRMNLVPINTLGPRINNEDASITDINIIPVCLGEVGISTLPFLECGTYGETEEDEESGTIEQPFAMTTLSNGEKENKEEYFDKMYVAFWDGANRHGTRYPHPAVDAYEVNNDMQIVNCVYSMRLTSILKPTYRSQKYRIDQNSKYNFKFIAEKIPDATHIFYIRGKQYMCEKITATFNEEGMSQLMKGTFYRLL